MFQLSFSIRLETERDKYTDIEDTELVQNEFDILVGTPVALEEYLVSNDIPIDTFDSIVFDEIHL